MASNIQYIKLPVSVVSDIAENLKCLQKSIGMCVACVAVALKDSIKIETGSATAQMNEVQKVLEDCSSSFSEVARSTSRSKRRLINSHNLRNEPTNGEVSGKVAVGKRKLKSCSSKFSEETLTAKRASGSKARLLNSPNLSNEPTNGENSGNVAVEKRKSTRIRKQARRSCVGVILPKNYDPKNLDYELVVQDGNQKSVISNVADYAKYFENSTPATVVDRTKTESATSTVQRKVRTARRTM